MYYTLIKHGFLINQSARRILSVILIHLDNVYFSFLDIAVCPNSGSRHGTCKHDITGSQSKKIKFIT